MGLMKSKLTTFDIILQKYKSHQQEELDADQRILIDRWNYADNLIRTYQDSKTIISMLMEKFHISEATAYRDVSSAKRFFGSINIGDKDYYRTLYAEQLEEWAKQAASKMDYKTATAAIKEAAEIRGLKDGDEARDLYLDLEPCKFELSVTINMNGDVKKTKIDLDRLESIEEAEYEMISESINTAVSVNRDQMVKLLNE